MITNLGSLRELVRDMMGRPAFAFDVETSGLDAHHDRLLGLSLTYEDDAGELVSEYAVFEHSEPSEDDPNIGIPRDYISRSAALHAIKPLFDQTDVTMIAHNAAFDLKFLWKWGADPQGQLWDTMIGEFIINENRPTYGLKETAARVFGAEMDKYADLREYTNFTKQEFMAVPLAPAAAYAEDDTRYTYKLWERQETLIYEEGVDKPFLRMEMPLVRVIAQMELRGFALDMEQIRAMREEFEAMSAESERKVWDAGMAMIEEWEEEGREIPPTYLVMIDHLKKDGIPVEESDTGMVTVRGRPVSTIQPTPRSKPRVPYFNVGSRNQLSDLFYGYYGVKVPTDIKIKRNKDGTVGVDRDTLVIMKHFLGDKAPPVLNDLLEWRKAEKFVGTYLKPFENRADPHDHFALRCNFNQTIARTGRLSSSSPNLQNIPSRGAIGTKARSLFVARPDYTLVVADFSNMEMRYAGHVSNDQQLIDAFAHDMDLHSLSASRGTGVEYAEFVARYDDGDPEMKRFRTIYKTVNFSVLYGCAPKTLQKRILVDSGILVDVDQAAKFIQDFDDAYPQLAAWKDKTYDDTRRKGYVKTIGGRKRRLPEIYSEDIWEQRSAERQAVSSVIQGSCADIMKMSLVGIQPRLLELGGSIICTVHDEVVAEVPTGKEDEAIEVIQSSMRKYNAILRIPMEAEASCGLTWGEAK